MNYQIKIEYDGEIDTLKEYLKFGKIKLVEIEKIKPTRSINQNSALHLYLKMISDEAREKGLTMDMIVKKPQELPITEYLLKDLFRAYGMAMFKKDSTAKLSKDEFSQVQQAFERIVAERLDITVPFPSIEDPFYSNLLDNTVH